MKKLFSLVAFAAFLSFAACNNEKKTDDAAGEVKEKVSDPSMTSETPVSAAIFSVKPHTCGPDCKDGSHVYAHGEIGHTCTEACGMSAHSCTEGCKAGNHQYAHGEIGHTCTEACAAM